MKLKRSQKTDNNEKILSSELITEKEGYDAMLYMLKQYYNNTSGYR